VARRAMSVVCGLRFLLAALVLLILAIASRPKLSHVGGRRLGDPCRGSDPVSEWEGRAMACP
jgi:hypothetical protein